MTSTNATTEEATVLERQSWMRTLSAADRVELETAWRHWEPKPEVEQIRGPEVGLAMVRGRADAGGARFNLGEATVTRATVRLHGDPLTADILGSCYRLGTDVDHARLAAVFDGMLSDPTLRERVLDEVVAPLDLARSERDATARATARSTKVEFFTVSREHA